MIKMRTLPVTIFAFLWIPLFVGIALHNIERFPDDFMLALSRDEFDGLRSQIVTSSWGGTRYAPMAFTEQGVAMLSSML